MLGGKQRDIFRLAGTYSGIARMGVKLLLCKNIEHKLVTSVSWPKHHTCYKIDYVQHKK
jgi:hypothetical protein